MGSHIRLFFFRQGIYPAIRGRTFAAQNTATDPGFRAIRRGLLQYFIIFCSIMNNT